MLECHRVVVSRCHGSRKFRIGSARSWERRATQRITGVRAVLAKVQVSNAPKHHFCSSPEARARPRGITQLCRDEQVPQDPYCRRQRRTVAVVAWVFVWAAKRPARKTAPPETTRNPQTHSRGDADLLERNPRSPVKA